MKSATKNLPKSSTGSSVPSHGVERFAGPEEVSVRIFENEIPEFVEPEMNRLYGNFFCSPARLGLMGEADKKNTYAACSDEEIVTLFLFSLENERVRVLNELIKISDEEINRFADDMFSHYPAVGAISFRAVETPVLSLNYPYQQFNCTEDIVLALPDSAPAYQSSLGKNMRKTINENMNKLKRRFPSFAFNVYEKKDANEQQIKSLIKFNQERMTEKNKTPGTGEEETENILRLVKACGLVSIITIDNRICAGQICFQAGANYFSLLNAHSPEFNEYRLGTLCNYLSICECIARGGKEFHFLWGREEFKSRFLGEQRDLDELVIYRSALHMARHGRLAVKTAINGRSRQIRLWLLDPKRKDRFAVRFAKKTLRHLRSHTH